MFIIFFLIYVFIISFFETIIVVTMVTCCDKLLTGVLWVFRPMYNTVNF